MGGPTGLAPNIYLAFFWDLDGNLFQLWSGTLAAGSVTGGKDSKVISRHKS